MKANSSTASSLRVRRLACACTSRSMTRFARDESSWRSSWDPELRNRVGGT
jgi:hypothetical protein